MKKGKNKEVTTLDEAVNIMLDAFQTNQDLFMGKIGSIEGEIGSLRTEMRDGFEKVNTEINKINLNAVDVVRKEEFDKLETRIGGVEKALDLKLKEA